MKTRLLLLVTALALLLSSFVTALQSQSSYELCQPGVYNVKSRSTSIEVQGGFLDVRYYFPDSDTPGTPSGGFETETATSDARLPAFIVLPGTNLRGTDPHHVLTENTSSGIGASLARRCYVAMVFLFRGQGPHADVDTEFGLMGSAELADLETLITNVKAAPGGADGDLVNDNAIGLGGFSQGASADWMATGEQDDRDNFKVGMPEDGYVIAESWILPNNCVNAHMAQFFAPLAYRTPWSPVETPPWTPAPGVSWDDTSFPPPCTMPSSTTTRP